MHVHFEELASWSTWKKTQSLYSGPRWCLSLPGTPVVNARFPFFITSESPFHFQSEPGLRGGRCVIAMDAVGSLSSLFQD